MLRRPRSPAASSYRPPGNRLAIRPSELGWAKLPNLKRLTDEISARPAAVKAVALKDKHIFKAEMDDEARRNMFKHVTA